MTTHELADGLTYLAKALKRQTDLPLGAVDFLPRQERNDFFHGGQFRPEQAGAALSLLSALADISKKDWHSLISYYSWPIAFNQRDSSRNVLGKVLTYLQENPNARKRLKQTTAPSSTSPALMNALKALLGES